jgi:hypothetical protein
VPLKPPEMRVRPPPRKLPRGRHVGIIRPVRNPHFLCDVDCWGHSGESYYLTTNTKMNQINGLILTQLPAPGTKWQRAARRIYLCRPVWRVTCSNAFARRPSVEGWVSGWLSG